MKISLEAKKRTLFGRKVKKLRAKNLIPANIFGKKIKSHAVEILQDKFIAVYREVGETGLINLVLDSVILPVLVKNVQVHPVTEKIIHVDFYQVDLKEKVTADVPIILVGKAGAVEQKLGVVLELLSEIEIEALPNDIPKNITVDITKLAKVGDLITVADIKLPSGVTSLADGKQEIVKIDELVTKEAEAQAKAEEAAATAAATASTVPEATAETPKTVAESNPAKPESRPQGK